MDQDLEKNNLTRIINEAYSKEYLNILEGLIELLEDLFM